MYFATIFLNCLKRRKKGEGKEREGKGREGKGKEIIAVLSANRTENNAILCHPGTPYLETTSFSPSRQHFITA